MKARYLFLSLLAATALPIPAADAAVLLIFGQTGAGDTVTGTRTLNSTTITSDTQVDITEIDATVVTPILATFTLNATNIGPATLSGGEILQRYDGSFTITNGGHQLPERNVLRCSLWSRWCADAIRFQSIADPERHLHL